MRQATHSRPLPVKSREAEKFWDGCAREVLLVQRCEECHRLQWFPRRYCRHCSSPRMAWEESTGRASIVSFTIVRRAMNEDLEAAVPYALAMVELDEGIQMMTNIVDAQPEDLRVGMAVSAVFERQADGTALPLFSAA